MFVLLLVPCRPPRCSSGVRCVQLRPLPLSLPWQLAKPESRALSPPLRILPPTFMVFLWHEPVRPSRRSCGVRCCQLRSSALSLPRPLAVHVSQRLIRLCGVLPSLSHFHTHQHDHTHNPTLCRGHRHIPKPMSMTIAIHTHLPPRCSSGVRCVQ